MYWAEVSDDRFYIPREAETERAAARARGEGGGGGRGRGEEARAGRARRPRAARARAANSSFDLSKLEVGDFRPKRARFAAFKEMALKPVPLKKAKVTSVYTPRVTDPLTAGRAYIYFFPLGQTEPAIVTLTDADGRDDLLAGRPPDHRARPHLQPGGPAAARAATATTTRATQVQP